MTTTTNQLMERLRSHGTNTYDLYRYAKEAADTIEALTGVDRINVDLHAEVQALQAESDYWRARYAALAHKGNV